MHYHCIGIFLCSLLVTIAIADNVCNITGKIDKDGEFPAKIKEYDVRPNIFIDKEHLLGIDAAGPHKKEFTYGNGPNGVAHWAKQYPKCGGKHQSPINIEIATLKSLQLPSLVWSSGYEELPCHMTLFNAHNTLVLEASYLNDQKPMLSGGPLDKNYLMKSLHFHWSSSDHKGAEHTINKKSYPMEMHVVHYRQDLNFTAAVATPKGLAVVGYIFEVSNDQCNEALTYLLNVADMAANEHDAPIDLPNMFRLDSLVDKIETDYVTYSGSLTTPPCHESVVWIISPYTITIAKKQLERFRIVSMAASGFGDNFRPVQPLNDRVVNFVKSKKIKN